MIIGTAGHIDHGKTALVRALTGVDTDRLPEEKRRGITIDLGFAPLDLPNVGTAGVVDVPGHEAFVRTMLAGATGIDLALLIVAADEGVMPQTREHVAILGLLGIRGGVVALTKRDLVDDEWLDLVRLDVAELLAGTPLEAAPVVPTSVVTGEGLGELRDALAAAASAIAPRRADDVFRMPVDRAFTVRGTGTVVTGTVWSGEVARDDAIRIMPGGATVRVRGLQAHGAAIDRATPGTRLAVALAGVEHDAVARGAVLVSDNGWHPTRVVRADVTLLADDAARTLSPRATVRFHMGTSEVGARVVTPGGPLASGETKAARVVLDAPLVLRAGDRFVIRGGSPVATLGGGIVVDPHPAHRRPRPWIASHASVAERLALALGEAGHEGLDVGDLAVRLGSRPDEVTSELARPNGSVLKLGHRIYEARLRDILVATIGRLVDDHHKRHPLDPGAALQTMRAQMAGRPELIDDAIRVATDGAVIEVAGGLVRRPGWSPRLSDDQSALKAKLVEALLGAGSEPPSVTELAAAHGTSVTPLMRILEREAVIVSVEADRYYAASALDSLVARLRDGMVPGREYSPGEIRDVIGLSRKFLIPFLEYCDRRGITERRSTGRVLHGT
ncbi:MAG TPA: selenocysteine-specific translation elongation factor [Gemmatimonadaceae bacterium]|nr:selenocysteine-specific translation elongation factor [Gemmatimonadaceae bacterium]